MHYTNFHAQFVFILLYVYIQMYFRIYKALKVLLWMISCRKKYWRRWSTRIFNMPFAGMSTFCRTDYIDLYPNNDLNHTSAPENISGHFGLLFLRAPYKFQFYFTLLYCVVERLCFCLTLININHCLYNCYIHICYKYCLNE